MSKCLDGVASRGLKVIVWNICMLQNTGSVCVLIPGFFNVFSLFPFECVSRSNNAFKIHPESTSYETIVWCCAIIRVIQGQLTDARDL
jgi:hypothetical protein